jgi:hypothetical protein
MGSYTLEIWQILCRFIQFGQAPKNIFEGVFAGPDSIQVNFTVFQKSRQSQNQLISVGTYCGSLVLEARHAMSHLDSNASTQHVGMNGRGCV